jgi:Putative peptidoglycan binding domain
MIKRCLSVVLAAVALTGFGQPLLAAQEKKKGGGKAKHAAAAQVQHAKASRGKAAGHRFTASNQGSVVRNQARAPQMRTSSSVAQRSVVRDRTRVSQTRTPTVALGGSQFRGTRFETRDQWRDSRDRSDYRYYRPPIDVYRNWDHGRIYTWNRHRYHWYDNAWVILDANIGYDYPTTYVYRDAPSGSLAAQVQARLAREGYDPGPIDGVIGPQTRDAIAGFQSDHGLPVTGRIDNSLVNALGL